MPVALGVNGGVLGSNNLPSSGSAKGIWTTNEIARAVALGFWPVNYARSITETATGADVISTGANADPYFNLTTLLLSTTATNGQQNNTFLDSSTNNFTITRNGNTTQGTFSPFSQTGWGNYFDGTSDYLTVNDNAALELGSSNFCLEFMYYPTSSANTDFVTKRVNASSYGVIIVQTGLALNFWLSSSGSSWDLFSNAALGSVTLNAWNHLAIYRIGNAWYSSLNGTITTLSASLSGSVVNNAANWNIGGNNYASGSVIGYLSNFRLVIGSSVYTSTSAPIPTAPLTAVTNTQLLTCQSNRFVDNSTNNFAVTPTGNTTVVPFSPFNPTSAWSASTVGGSGYFDGSGDYLTANGGTAANLGTTWTVECWLYPNNVSGTGAIVNVNVNTANQGINIYRSGATITVDNGGSAGTGPSGGTLVANTWQHVAVVADGTNTKIYLNGSQVGSTFPGTVTSGTPTHFWIGSAYTGLSLWAGYISNVRIVKGVAVYTGAFTPPTAPITDAGSTSAASYPSTTNVNTSFASSATSLLLNFTNAGIYDATAKNVLETVGNAQVSTTQSKWSPTSMYFDGTGDYLLIPDNPSQRIGTGNFTVECWVYRNASGTYGLIGKGTGTTGWLLSLNSSNQVVFTYGSSTITSTGTISATTWTHIAVVRSGTGANLTKIYIGGTNDGTGTVSTDFNQTNAMYVAADRTGGSNANAYVQDTRVTLYARYSANFTPPTAAFPVQ